MLTVKPVAPNKMKTNVFDGWAKPLDGNGGQKINADFAKIINVSFYTLVLLFRKLTSTVLFSFRVSLVP